ncbi:synapse-associated protein 1-like isoform X2 [Ptychodera flava]|uniref:synapse-associated protein 1-like isoform X2 n=1 Tax=Ptychodera flava TaxID=63121 RepID=UPI00396A1693
MFQVSSWFGYNTESKPKEEQSEQIGGEEETSSSSRGKEDSDQPAEPTKPDEATDQEDKRTEQEGGTVPSLSDLTGNVSAEAALNSAKEWGSYLFSFAKEGTKVVTETASKTANYLKETVEEKTILGDFQKEQEKFVKEKHKRSDAAVPPWVGYNEEEQMKQQIMALSQDKRNFLRNPPAGVQFNFDFESCHPVAMATLAEDENLRAMRFSLVPKQIKENNFWRNYFYRVSLIKQSSQLTTLAAETDGNHSQPIDITDDNKKEDDDLPPDSPTNEFISDAFSSDLDQADIQKGMQQLGMDKKNEQGDDKKEVDDDVPEWEKELQQELQEYEVVDGEGAGDNEQWEDEINQMLEEESQ